MKKKYIIPDMGVIQFEERDVITASDDLPFVPFSEQVEGDMGYGE